MCEESRECDETPSPTTKTAELIPGYSSVEQFTKDGFKTLMEAIKHSNALPSARDWDFYNTSDSFKKIINAEGSSVLHLMNQVMRCNEMDSNIRNRVLDEKIELIIEANDTILEKVANNVDELNGIRKTVAAPVELQTVRAELPINGSWNRPSVATFTVNSTVSQTTEKNCIKLITAKNIIRPQKLFKDKVDNRNKVPWFPRITDKPNSLKPLAIFLEECEDRQEFSHPYEFELFRFAPTPAQLVDEKSEPPKPPSETPLIEITTAEQLDELVETLRSCKEFAVDVEHHSYRSFMGITCLLQISTQDKDYLIDTLLLRDKLHVLNEVFTKNTIVKIFHGADNDIEWLQRDLSLYVVNMFDTHQAAKLLQYQALSLAFLMKKFCNILPNKQFQLADWRIRPLPDELKQYAREDTHYLIYIYKMLKKELLSKANKADNFLKSVIDRSTEICKKRYFKPILHDDSHLTIYRKCKKMFDNRQLYALKEIFAWRDNLAREEDESPVYVLPNHMMLQISENLPREMQGILACCNPVPPLVRSNLLQLHQIILKAREQPLEKAIMKDTTGRGVLKKVSKVNVDSALHCPHDLSKTPEFRDDLPTLLDNEQFQSDIRTVANVSVAIEKPSSYSIFDDSSDTDVFNERKTFKKLRGFAYFSPYERYKLVKPFVVAEDQAAQAQQEETKKNVESTSGTKDDKTEERTDEERIASIRDHFVQLSRKFSAELQAQKEIEDKEEERQKQLSLMEMGGSNKRKREDEFDYAEDALPAETNFHCPRPNMNHNSQFYGRRNKGKKRKFDEISDNTHEQKQEVHQKKKKFNKNRNQRKQQQAKNNQQISQNSQNQNYKREIKEEKNYGGGQMGAQYFNQNQAHQNKKGKKQNKKQKGGQMPNQQYYNKPKQNFTKSNENVNFTPYDYASVDFRQFQGGAGSANSGVQVKHNFKQKNNRKINNKKGAKSAIFPNRKPNRGGHHNKNY
ncbi:exosome complex component 10 homolog [Zophobas morio]|uniref:exosome complex component 10 homolog n=1 Tax=Zophobas morio TaxID=2755281 RepID=UPI0030828F14